MEEDYAIIANRAGTYDSSKLYCKHDLVTSNGKEYLAVIASKGEDLDNPRFWTILNKGPKGDPGKNGSSAYEDWIAEGHAGSRADFLKSLIGPQGVPGQPGKIEGFIQAADTTKYKSLDELVNGPVFYLSSTLENQPLTSVTQSFLIVMSNTDASLVTQIWIDPATNNLYMRSLVSGKWSDWTWITQWN